jgi:hypothetical protein
MLVGRVDDGHIQLFVFPQQLCSYGDPRCSCSYNKNLVVLVTHAILNFFFKKQAAFQASPENSARKLGRATLTRYDVCLEGW